MTNDNELTAENLRVLVERYKSVYEKSGRMFPQEPVEQMKLAAYAVFDSWNSDRAKKYMAINQITGLKGTAVTVQSRVFGNMGETSGTGVCFTRNPSTGENLLYGEVGRPPGSISPHAHTFVFPLSTQGMAEEGRHTCSLFIGCER